MNQQNNGPKVMASYRISPDLKLELAAKAKELDMTMSQYQEALIVGRHKKFQEVLKALPKPVPPPIKNPNNFKIDDSVLEELNELLDKIRMQYPSKNDSQLLLAALHYLLYKEKHFITKSFNTFLK